MKNFAFNDDQKNILKGLASIAGKKNSSGLVFYTLAGEILKDDEVENDLKVQYLLEVYGYIFEYMSKEKKDFVIEFASRIKKDALES